MNSVVAASRQPGLRVQLSTQCAAPGTETSSAWGMVRVAATTLAGGSVGSAMPLRNTTGTLVCTVADTPGSCGQLVHSACRASAFATVKIGPNGEPVCWRTFAGSTAAQESLH